MYWLAQAPANIALIKYMGKKETHSNLPDNSSLSYTLNNLLSTVRLELSSTSSDYWQPLPIPGTREFLLAEAGQKRFIAHLERLKKIFAYPGHFFIQSNNNFPHGSGLASSASSFAALTRCAAQALSELTHKELPSVEQQAHWSRLGSGSSCRSFYSPWALWNEEQVSAIDLPYKDLIHQVLVISAQEKAVSSSEAHQRVKTSSAYIERSHRAELRLNSLLQAFTQKNWAMIFQLCWDEFQDMHQLFSTCEHSFSYMTAESVAALNIIQDLWHRAGDGPLVTMDAGPNIHLLYREDQVELAQQFTTDYLLGQYHVL